MTQNTGLKWQRDDFANITEPFENDLLNRKPLAEHLTRYIDRLQVGAVLALDARWGEGKTWFVMHWQKYLEQTAIPHKVIYINAFAQDYIDDPFLLIAAELRAVIAQDLPAQKRFTEKAMQVGKVLTPVAYKAAVNVGAKWIMGINDGSDKLEKLQEQLIDATSEQVGLWVENQIKEHENNKNAFANFKVVLKELAAKHDQPIVIIIDELDRCNPLFSVRLIERIKHFFDIPNIVFVLVCDKLQLQKTICHQFGYDENLGEAYLEKFIDFSIILPRSKPSTQENPYHKQIQTIVSTIGIDKIMTPILQIDATIYASSNNLSIRQVKKLLNQFSLLMFDEIDKNRMLMFTLFNMGTNNDLFDSIAKTHSYFFRQNNHISSYISTTYEIRQQNIMMNYSDQVHNILNDTLRYFNLEYCDKEKLTLAKITNIKISEHYEDKNYPDELNAFRPTSKSESESNLTNEWNEYINTGLNE